MTGVAAIAAAPAAAPLRNPRRFTERLDLAIELLKKPHYHDLQSDGGSEGGPVGSSTQRDGIVLALLENSGMLLLWMHPLRCTLRAEHRRTALRNKTIALI